MRSGLRAAARTSLRLAVMVAALLFLAKAVAWRDVADVLRRPDRRVAPARVAVARTPGYA
jgi:hypothetical protein